MSRGNGARARHRNKRARRFLNRVFWLWPFCQWCWRKLSRSEATTDHVVPLAGGGECSWENSVVSCEPCNNGRGSRPAAVAPFGPRWGRIVVMLIVLLPTCSVAQAQQAFQPPRQGANYLPVAERQRLVFERSQRAAEARQQRVSSRRQSCGQRVEWYMGTDGFWVRSY